MDLGTTDYALSTQIVRDGVYGIFHHVRSKTPTGFTVSISTTQGYAWEGFPIEWIVFV